MVSIQTDSGLSVLEGLQIDNLWEAARELGFPCALWKLPHAGEIRLLITIQQGVSQANLDLEKLSPGFMIAPFVWQQEDQVLFMNGDIIVTFMEDKIVQVDNKLGEEHPEVKRLVDTAVSISKSTSVNDRTYKPLGGKILANLDAKERYKRAVELAVAAINGREFKKVVLSRTKEIEIDKDFQPVRAFHRLADAYHHAFVSLVNLPNRNELWLGASPETLVRQQTEGTFSTMSLAGTQRAYNERNEIIPKYDIRWGQKEIEEHALVSRYIVECFKKIRLREYLETGPKTVRAGNVYHLRTEFEVDTIALNFPELGTTMLKLLHPTSAICGEPKVQSRQFITQVEGYDRSLFSGFIGPVQIAGQSDIFVNLRTVRLKDDVATLYAGAGITEDSVPEHEWNETELKCNTLLSVIG
jgi:isochorismate synthase